MEKTVRAKFSGGVFKPLEKVELEEGKEVAITISEVPSLDVKKFIKSLRATAGGWRELIDAEALKREIYDQRLIRTRPEVEL